MHSNDIKRRYRMGVTRFYEGPSAIQHPIGKLSSDVSQTNDLGLISAPVRNEQALSCTFLEVQAGTKIRLFNTPCPSANEGYMEITVWSYVEDRCVPHLSVDFSDEQVVA